ITSSSQGKISPAGRPFALAFLAAATKLSYPESATLSPAKTGSWQNTARPSRVRRRSHSKPSQPCCNPSSNALRVFSGASSLAPRCARASGRDSVKVNVSDPIGVRGIFGPLHGFLKFLFQHIGFVLLRLHRLAEERLAAVVLVFHRPRRLLKIVEHLWAHRRSMRDHCAACVINLNQRRATRGSD